MKHFVQDIGLELVVINFNGEETYWVAAYVLCIVGESICLVGLFNTGLKIGRYCSTVCFSSPKLCMHISLSETQLYRQRYG